MISEGSQCLYDSLALRDLINPQIECVCSIEHLAKAIDIFMLASWELRQDAIASIEDVDLDHIAETDDIRRQFSKRFPNLGHYWVALDSKIMPDAEGQLAVGDAINDLIDIWRELSEVKLLLDHYGETQALAGLKFRYHHHLWMHFLPLRSHLETLIFD